MTSLLSAPSDSLPRAGSQTPRVANYPAHPFSIGPDVIGNAADFGLILDPWQCLVLEHGLGQTLDERWTATRTGCWVPRQNGKGAIIQALVLYWLFCTDEPEMVCSAHQDRTAEVTFNRVRALLRGSEFDPETNRDVAVRTQNGKMRIEFEGRKCHFTTRSDDAMRGFSVGKVIFDEAQECDADQMAALLPTLSAIPGQQSWYFGTPPTDPTAWCYGLKEDGQRGDVPRLAWFDWGIEWVDLAKPDDQALVMDLDTWYACNPALGVRIEVETVEDESRPSGLGDKFAQERLGMWPPRATLGRVITKELWQRIAEPAAERPDDVAFALHVNLARTHAAIAFAGRRADGRIQVGITADAARSGPDRLDYRAGTDWVLPRLLELRERWNPVAIAVDTRSESLLMDLAKAGIEAPQSADEPRRGDLAMPTAAEVASAFGLFVDAVRHEQLRHLDDAPVNVALAGAAVRRLAGGSTWDFRSTVDVSPLVAVTLANWAYESRAHLVRGQYDPLTNIF